MELAVGWHYTRNAPSTLRHVTVGCVADVSEEAELESVEVRQGRCLSDGRDEGRELMTHSSLLYWLWLVSAIGYWLHMRRVAESSALSWYYWTLWRPKWSWIILKHPVLTAQSTHFFSAIQTSQLMLYIAVIAVCSEIHTQRINTPYGQNAASNHWPWQCVRQIHRWL